MFPRETTPYRPPIPKRTREAVRPCSQALHIGTGFYLVYLTWAAALNFSVGYHLWL